MGSIIQMMPAFMQEKMEGILPVLDQLCEIRLRSDKPVILQLRDIEKFLTPDGQLTDCEIKAWRISDSELDELFLHLCKYSVYAFSEEMKQGFITLPGGHRVGIAGQIVMDEEKSVKSLKNIRYLNIRVAHEVKNVSVPVLSYLYKNGELMNTLIIAPPGQGKTTMLRDLIREVSNGNPYGKGVTVSVVDERSEIAGCYMGKAQNDLGIRTDVLDACPKCVGMMILLRAMAPAVIAVDELGNKDDMEALYRVTACGCKMLATIHGDSYVQIRRKEYMRKVIDDGVFQRFLVIGRKSDERRRLQVFGEDGRECFDGLVW